MPRLGSFNMCYHRTFCILPSLHSPPRITNLSFSPLTKLYISRWEGLSLTVWISQHLAQDLVHNKHLINLSWMNECFLWYKDEQIWVQRGQEAWHIYFIGIDTLIPVNGSVFLSLNHTAFQTLRKLAPIILFFSCSTLERELGFSSLWDSICNSFTNLIMILW